jgi:hypothetical protein
MAEMIGSSRETVTRLFRTFKEDGLINVNGRVLSIPDRARLEQLVGYRPPNGNGKYSA